MIDLDSPLWETLATAYGSAEKAPPMLRALQEDASDEKGLAYLWSALIHQGDVHHAAFAALPHVWAIALGAHGDARESLLAWTRDVVGSGFDVAYLPPPVRVAYQGWLETLRGTLPSRLSAPADRDLVLAALVVIAPDEFVVFALQSMFDDGYATIACECEQDLFVVWDAGELRIFDTDEFDGLPAAMVVDASTATLTPEVARLVDFAKRAAQPDLAAAMTALCGAVTCPGCTKHGTFQDLVD